MASKNKSSRFFLVSSCPGCGLDLTQGLVIKGDSEDFSVKMTEEGEIKDCPQGYVECVCGCWLEDYQSSGPCKPRKLTYRKAVEVGEYPTGDVGNLAKSLINHAVTNRFLELLQGNSGSVENLILEDLDKLADTVKSWRKRFEDRYCQSSKPQQKAK